MGQGCLGCCHNQEKQHLLPKYKQQTKFHIVTRPGPEQVQDKPVNPPVDLLSQNIVLSELSTSCSPVTNISSEERSPLTDFKQAKMATQSDESTTKRQNDDFWRMFRKQPSVIAAIDFGTAYTGYAYWLERGQDIDPIDITADKSWSDGGQGMQAPTTILLNPDEEFHSFGREAERKYEQLHLLGEDEDWHYFRRIKTMLDKVEKLTKYTVIFDSEDRPCPVQPLLAHAIKYTKQHIDDRLAREFGDRFTASDVYWVITVPADWAGAKQEEFLRNAASEAGIKKKSLFLVSEPEAAISFYEKMARNNAAGLKERFNECIAPGKTFLLVDLAGDVTETTVLHRDESLNKWIMKHTERDSNGAEGVNKAFAEFLKDIFGEGTIKEILQNHRKQYIDFLRAFEVEKRQLTQSDIDKNAKCVLPLPQVITKDYGEDIENRLKQSGYDNNVSLAENCLVLSASQMKKFFTEVIGHIKNSVNEILAEEKFSNISCVVIVGGFAESSVVRHELKSYFEKETFIPYFTSLAVLKGAVICGNALRKQQEASKAGVAELLDNY